PRILVLCHPSLFHFKTTSTTDSYTLSLHDALPISTSRRRRQRGIIKNRRPGSACEAAGRMEADVSRSLARGARFLLRSRLPRSRPHGCREEVCTLPCEYRLAAGSELSICRDAWRTDSRAPFHFWRR